MWYLRMCPDMLVVFPEDTCGACEEHRSSMFVFFPCLYLPRCFNLAAAELSICCRQSVDLMPSYNDLTIPKTILHIDKHLRWGRCSLLVTTCNFHQNTLVFLVGSYLLPVYVCCMCVWEACHDYVMLRSKPEPINICETSYLRFKCDGRVAECFW